MDVELKQLKLLNTSLTYMAVTHLFMYLDDRGRYAFDCQPEICKWNCHKLAEALEPVLEMSRMEDVLQSYDHHYEEFYHNKMMKKVSFINVWCTAFNFVLK